MVAEASTVIEQQEWLLIPSGALIALTILAFGLLGDAVRDAAALEDTPPAPAGRRAFWRAFWRAAARPGPPAAQPGASPVDATALLSVRGLSVTRPGPAGPTLVVDAVNFDVFRGEAVGLVGESGCGKTVTALAVLRLLSGSLAVAAGEAQWTGRDLLRMPDRDFGRLRGSALAYVSQEPQGSLDPCFTVGSQLSEVIRRHDRVSRSAARARMADLLRQVELPDPTRTARSYPHELSGGMAQRVALALALAGRPQLLIADEPTTALDVTVQAEMLALLRRLQRETGMAILLDHPRLGRGRGHLRPDPGDVRGPGRRARRRPGPLRPSAASLHPGPAAIPPFAGPRGAADQCALRPGCAAGAWPAGCRFAPRCGFADDACQAGPVLLTEHGAGRQARCLHTEQVVRTEVNA